MKEVAEARLGEVEQLIRRGLSARPRWLPMFYLYDERGSELYERITQLPEYYLTRTEAAILREHADDILRAAGTVRHVIELGSGSSVKTQILLRRALDRGPVVFHPIDISPATVEWTRRRLEHDLPGLRVDGHVGDYREVLPTLDGLDSGARLILFLGSSIGNYDPERARPLLDLVRDLLRPGDRFLLGVDHVKDPAVLEAAYDDAAGVTAQFNLNLLHRINRELGGDFDTARWRHRAVYNAGRQRIEMHLVALDDMSVHVPGLGIRFDVHAGETIHTENSFKYTPESLAELAARSRMRVERRWTDPDDAFSVNLLAPA